MTNIRRTPYPSIIIYSIYDFKSIMVKINTYAQYDKQCGRHGVNVIPRIQSFNYIDPGRTCPLKITKSRHLKPIPPTESDRILYKYLYAIVEFY
jgi:hypothetical protein